MYHFDGIGGCHELVDCLRKYETPIYVEMATWVLNIVYIYIYIYMPLMGLPRQRQRLLLNGEELKMKSWDRY